MRFGVPASALLVSVLAVATACEENKPYTPFEVTTALPPPPSAPPAAPAASSAPPTTPSDQPLRRAMKAPRGATTWKVGDRTLQAPEGHVFQLALPLDAEPGKRGALLVWTFRPARGSTPATGNLWLHADGSPRTIAELPGFVPVSPDCEHSAQLDQTGPRTVTLDVSARCTARLVARAPTRSVLVLDPLRPDPLLMGFRVADAAAGESLELAVDSRDLDGDGRDDVTLRVTVTATAPKQTASVQFAWFDRAAGRSRDAREPQESFRKAVARLAASAKNKKNAPAVGSDADGLRRLYSSVCAEGATPRLWLLDGAALTCGSDASVASALAAELDAALTSDRLLEAVGLLERDGWFGGNLGSKERARLEQALLARIRNGEAGLAGAFVADLRPRSSEPRFSPLLFDREGRLWVRSSDARVLLSDPPGTSPRRLDVGAGGAPVQDPTPDPWPLRVMDAAGRTWTGIVPSCDRSELQLTFVGRDGMPLPPQPISLLAPRPGSCRRMDGRPVGAALPIAWRGGQLEAWIAGKRIGEGNAPATSPAGAPRSATGSTLVLPGPLGLLVVRGESLELWTGERTRGVGDCVPSEAGDRVACVKDRSVVVFDRPGALAGSTPRP